MLITELELQNFRNYEKQKIEFNNNINIFYGDNAQGKTNIIESIFISAFGKSFRTSREKELIKYKGGCCQKCGYNKCLEALQLHHRNPEEKEFELSDYKYFKIMPMERYYKEADKCDCRSDDDCQQKHLIHRQADCSSRVAYRLFVERKERVWQSRNDTSKDDERDAVAYATVIDLLA